MVMKYASTEVPHDEELIRRYRGGDSRAFQTLLERYQRGILFFVRQFFPNPERAEEIFQEVFMKVLERLDYFDSSGSFRGWLYTLCRNHCIDRLRYQKRRPELPDSSFGDEERTNTPLTLQENPGPLPDREVYEKELATCLNDALQRLPEEQRETFILKERSGMTFEEIARSTGVSVNTVKSRMRYALTTLRRVLKNKGFVKEALQ